MKMSRETLDAILRRPGYSIDGAPVARLPNPERQPNKRSQSQDCQLDKSTRGVGYRITLISLRRKLVDGHDNLRTGAKPIVDCITRSLGFASDDNPRLQWEYAQVISDRPGTIVRIAWV